MIIYAIDEEKTYNNDDDEHSIINSLRETIEI